MTSILANYISSNDQETQAVALRWVSSFLILAKTTMLPFTPLILESILPTLSHSIPAIRSLAIDANTNLFTLVMEFVGVVKVYNDVQNTTQENPFDIFSTVSTLMQQCQHQNEDTRIGALEWLVMLHKKYPKQVPYPKLLFTILCVCRS